jgi:high-affinity iron transporter
VRLDLARFFRWTGLFLIFVSAGLLATALHELHEAGLWNALLEPAYDTSGILRETSPLGAVLRGLFGYSASPTIGEAVVYWAYLGPILFLFLRGERLPGFAHGTAQARN